MSVVVALILVTQIASVIVVEIQKAQHNSIFSEGDNYVPSAK